MPTGPGDPTWSLSVAGVRRQLPEPGGTCFLIIQFPSDAVFADLSFDAAAARAEREAAFPGVANQLKPDNSGMHTTNSVDYLVVLDGELCLDLDGGHVTRLGPGDTVVQNGTRHAWRNLSDRTATVAVVQVGAERKG